MIPSARTPAVRAFTDSSKYSPMYSASIATPDASKHQANAKEGNNARCSALYPLDLTSEVAASGSLVTPILALALPD